MDELKKLSIIQSLRREAELNGDAGRWFNEGIRSICMNPHTTTVDHSLGIQYAKGQAYAIERLKVQ